MNLDHVGLSVADLDAQARWYAGALDLEESTPFALEPLGLRGVFLVDREHGWAIELLHRTGSRPGLQAADPPEAILTQGYGHICLRVEDVDATYDRLIAAGATDRMAPRPAPEPGVRMAFVADPEGHLIELLDRGGPVGWRDGEA
ncbi:VOC family protein [Demequina pelophila]|uniref:VOC family protein n=1 Tax=Demequina pelophila TaxID=1638984 RepID=UPI0007801F24|nr:VOC family protein [Demequina pelophila]